MSFLSHRSLASAASLAALCATLAGAPAFAAPIAGATTKPPETLPRAVQRTEPQGEQPTGRAARAPRRPLFPPPPLEEVYVFQDSLDGRSLDDEGGWTHFDASGGPTAWHIDTFQGCTNHAWWCGKIDSSWVLDSNRAGYGNSWYHVLENSVSLAGVPSGTTVTLSFQYRMNCEARFDGGQVQVGDLTDIYVPLGDFTGIMPPSGCGVFSVVVPESSWMGWNNYPGGPKKVPFRFVFNSDIAYSSEDGLYQGDGWVIDNVEVDAGATVKFFDDMENGMGTWTRTTLPAVGDYFNINNHVTTEDLCTDNRTNVWVDWDPVTFSLIPRLDDRLVTPSVATQRSSQVLVAFDIYRNLPLDACFYYSLLYRTRNVGDPTWGPYKDPTGFLYYGSSKDWIRQKVTLPEAGNKDSVQVQFVVKDYGQIYCGGPTAFSDVYPLFDNIAIGIKQSTPPIFVQRDLDLFQDTFRTTAFFGNDNFNTPLGDSAVVQVSTSRGYKNGFMYYRTGTGSWSSASLQVSSTSYPTYRWADVPAGAYPAGTTLQYYFAVTDSADSVAYLPTRAPQTQTYFSASVLPVKSATNPALGCTDSLAQILFVNNTFGREPAPYIATALTAQGYKFDTWDVNGPTTGAGNTPGGPPVGDPFYFWPPATTNDLLRYSTIIWHAGSLSQFTVRPPDQALLQSWIQQPGKSRNLYVIGDNVAWEMIVLNQNFNSFLDFTLGARYLRNVWEEFPQDTLHPIITGYTGSPTAGRFMHANSDCPQIEDFDLLAIATGAPARGKTGNFLRYPNNFPAATRFATKYVSFGTDSARAVLQAFNFNNIEEGGERIRLIKNVMTDYFQVPACFYPTAVEEDPASGAPAVPNMLYQNAPNPFNPETTIRYSLANAGQATIRIYGAGGALVRTLVDRFHTAGVYTTRWDGKDDAGHKLSSGVYFYKLETSSGTSAAKKLLMLK